MAYGKSSTHGDIQEHAPARLLIAESSDLVRAGIIGVVSNDQDLTIVSETDAPHTLRDLCGDVAPDLTIVGVPANSPARQPTLEAIRGAKRGNSGALFVALVDDSGTDAIDAVRAGASGVLTHGSSGDMLLSTIHNVLAGGCALEPALLCALFAVVGQEGSGARARGPRSTHSLSPRELEVLRALADGLRGAELASELGVSLGTVKTHIRHILRKLDAPDRMSAVLKAQREHLLDIA